MQNSTSSLLTWTPIVQGARTMFLKLYSEVQIVTLSCNNKNNFWLHRKRTATSIAFHNCQVPHPFIFWNVQTVSQILLNPQMSIMMNPSGSLHEYFFFVEYFRKRAAEWLRKDNAEHEAKTISCCALSDRWPAFHVSLPQSPHEPIYLPGIPWVLQTHS